MTVSVGGGPRGRLRLLAVLVTLLALPVPPALAEPTAEPTAEPADAGGPVLDLGAPTLPEVRSTQVLEPGVQLVRITRGVEPAAATGSTEPAPAAPTDPALGPWHVAVLRIDPRAATGRLVATPGPDLARSETTSDLVAAAGGLAGVNASYFAFDKDKAFPGDPVGLGLYDGHLRSEPGATSTEVDVLLDARTGAVRLGRLGWSGSVRNRRTRARLALTHLDSPPRVPKGCTRLKDPRRCRRAGDVVRFDRSFALRTPSGPGVEVLLGRDGCVVATARSRGRRIGRHQTSLQATGKEAKALLRLAPKGACLRTSTTLSDQRGRTVGLHAGLYGVAGRYRLVEAGRVVAPDRTTGFFSRQPRTLVGTTADGVVTLVTVDGRQAASVGVTLAEAARVAVSLGVTDAVNLDGGGSTTMVANSLLVNRPSGAAERKVGDALVYVPR